MNVSLVCIVWNRGQLPIANVSSEGTTACKHVQNGEPLLLRNSCLQKDSEETAVKCIDIKGIAIEVGPCGANNKLKIIAPEDKVLVFKLFLMVHVVQSICVWCTTLMQYMNRTFLYTFPFYTFWLNALLDFAS